MPNRNILSLANDDYLNDAPFIEKILFAKRPVVVVVFLLLTMFFGWHALQIEPEASFIRMIPTSHQYIKNYLEHKEDMKGLGNSVRICVENTDGSIFTKEYMEVLKNMTDDVFFIPGVNRGALKSLFMPVVRWNEVTEDGFDGGPVVPSSYDGSPESLEQVRQNVFKSGRIGSLVANDLKSSVILATLEDIDPETGKPLDYRQFSKKLEEVRTKFQSEGVKIHITGFAKIVGDLIEGSTRVFFFFIIAFVILLFMLYINARCLKSTLMRAISSLTAVILQLGIMKICGYGINPYSMLVPFLMFALGVSHGIQFFNGMAHEMTGGANRVKASRLAFRLIYRPGMAALATDAIGFAVLMVINIGVIQDIAIGASIGVAVVAFTDLMYLPVLMSYSGISPKTIDIVKKRQAGTSHPVWYFMSKFTQKRYAGIAIFLAILGLVFGLYVRKDLKYGDLDQGAPELRSDSRYNLDNAYMNDHYSSSSDVFVVMLKTPPEGNSAYPVVVAADKLSMHLRQLKGVQSVQSYVDSTKRLNSAFNEGMVKWYALPRSQVMLDIIAVKIPVDVVNRDGKLSPIVVYLDDHKAETLDRVVRAVEAFAEKHNTKEAHFLLAAGNAGIEAVTNIEVEKALYLLTILIYGVVFLVCLLTYRDVKGALCVVIPLTLTTVLCEALMAKLGIGIKVATLPVIAVGVGIGVDYGIYIYNKLLYYRDRGHKLTPAFYRTLNTTGRAITFTGITLAVGVATWAFSPIKFQADMGILLTFMFLWNMVGAMVLLPALARFLIFRNVSDCIIDSCGNECVVKNIEYDIV